MRDQMTATQKRPGQGRADRAADPAAGAVLRVPRLAFGADAGGRARWSPWPARCCCCWRVTKVIDVGRYAIDVVIAVRARARGGLQPADRQPVPGGTRADLAPTSPTAVARTIASRRAHDQLLGDDRHRVAGRTVRVRRPDVHLAGHRRHRHRAGRARRRTDAGARAAGVRGGARSHPPRARPATRGSSGGWPVGCNATRSSSRSPLRPSCWRRPCRS